jgi:hypothetical protein
MHFDHRKFMFPKRTLLLRSLCQPLGPSEVRIVASMRKIRTSEALKRPPDVPFTFTGRRSV